MNDKLRETHEKLRALRERKNLTLKPTPLLRGTFIDIDGEEKPLKLRYYQVQMVFHLLAMARFVVGDDTGCGKCTTRDTLIETDKGLVPIGDLQPTQRMGPDTFAPVEGWKVRIGDDLVPVKSFYYSGYKPTRRVRTRYGFEVEGSLVHPLYTRGSGGEVWRKTHEIERGDFLCVDRGGSFPEEEPRLQVPVVGEGMGANAKTYDVPDRMTPDLARLLGYIVGEGWTNNRHTFHIFQSQEVNPEVHRDIQRLLHEVLGRDVGDKDTMLVHSVFLRKYLEHMGVDYTTSHDKRVPPPILQATRESSREFLRGLFEGEAHVSSMGGVEFSTSSERLGKEVQLLLLRFGIVVNRSPKTVPGFDHVYWRLTIFGDDARKFAAEIGFISSRKQERLYGVLPEVSNTNHDVVPFSRPMVEVLREEIYKRSGLHGHKGEGISTRWGSAFYNTLGHIRNNRRNPTYTFLEKLSEVALEVGVPSDHPALVAIQDIVRRRFFYDPVAEIEEGFKEVVDIEVDDPRHAFVGNGLVNHNTIETIAALCYLWQMHPNTKVVILAKKSAVGQWEREFRKFTDVTGINIIVSKGAPAVRKEAYARYTMSTGPTVLISGYRSIVRDFKVVQEWKDYIFVTDEGTVYKNPGTQVHQVCRHMGVRAYRVWCLTATLIKNHLLEGYGIYQVVVPGLFAMTKNKFMEQFTIWRMQKVGRGRQIRTIVGYTDEHVRKFKDKIDPYYLGRPKHAVASELPVLTSKNIKVGMTRFQHEKYQECLGQMLEMGDGEIRETDKLTQIIYCQEIANHLCLLGFEDTDSEKMDTLVDLLTEGGQLEGEKVIVFTRFRKLVDFAVPYMEKKGIKCVRVTGSEDDDERDEAMEAFQDLKSDVQVIWITMAGGDSINLQAAKAMIFYDSPWSAGDYLQILGRMIRIGSVHDRVYAIHLIVTGSVDGRVQTVLRKKMKLVEAILGKRIKGEGDTDQFYDATPDTTEIFNGLLEDARGMLT